MNCYLRIWVTKTTESGASCISIYRNKSETIDKWSSLLKKNGLFASHKSSFGVCISSWIASISSHITCDSCCSIDWVYHHNWGQRRGGCHYLQTKSSISGWRVETDTHPCSSCQEDRSSPLGGCWWTSCHGWWWRIENNLTMSLYITLRSTDLQTCLLILSHQSVIRMICKQFSLNTT